MGGMAEVFRAHGNGADGFRKEVCIKRILPQFCEDEDFVRMFKDEAKLAARLSHANIVQIFDFDQVDGSYFIAMEYVAGKDLRTVIRVGFQKAQPPGIYRACTLVAEMCKGLHHAHQKDGLHLVHRDVSPHNVLVSMAGEVKVMDFGIAKATDRITRTSTGIIKGKIAYMAPEQAAGGDLDHRVDQFATGLVFYELLTGRRAFDGPEPVALRKALSGEVSPPSLVAPDTPPELDEIFLRATARHPMDRYPDMRALERALMAFVYRRAPEDDQLDLGRYMNSLFVLAPPPPRIKTTVLDVPDVAPPAPVVPPALQVTAPETPAQPALERGLDQPVSPSVASAPTVTSMPSAAAATAGSIPSLERVIQPPPRARDSHATVTVQGTPTPHMPPAPEDVMPPVAQPGEPAVPSPLVTRANPSPRVLFGAAFAGALALGAAGVALVSWPTPPTPAPVAPAGAAPTPVETVAAMAAPDRPAPTSAPPAGTTAQPPTNDPPAAALSGDPDKPGKQARGKVRVVNQGGWAQVWVRGRMVLGETPGDFTLEAGRHVLTFKNPETNKQATLTITVKAGATTRVVQPLQ